MPRECTVCAHPERAAIDRALVAGEPAPRIAALRRVSADALLRHRANHLPKLLAQARDRDTERATAMVEAVADRAAAGAPRRAHGELAARLAEVARARGRDPVPKPGARDPGGNDIAHASPAAG